MNRISSLAVLTLFLNKQSQKPLPGGKVLHQTLIEVHTAEVLLGSGCEGITFATWKLFRTLSRPTQSVGIEPDGASQL